MIRREIVSAEDVRHAQESFRMAARAQEVVAVLKEKVAEAEVAAQVTARAIERELTLLARLVGAPDGASLRFEQGEHHHYAVWDENAGVEGEEAENGR